MLTAGLDAAYPVNVLLEVRGKGGIAAQADGSGREPRSLAAVAGGIVAMPAGRRR